MEEEKNIKSDKHQTELLIGFALLILGVIFACFALMQPKVSSENTTVSTETNSIRYQETESFNQNNTKSSYSVNSNVSSKKETNRENKSNKSANVTYPLNLNTCTSAELQTIDNIGKTRADAIIAYRDYLGGYTSVEQLKDISGIGDSVFNSIEPFVAV